MSGARLRAVARLLCGCLCIAGTAQAQGGREGPSLRRHHVTLTGGVTWTGGYAIGDATAQLRGNAVGTSAPPFTLFRAESAIDGAAGVEARVGYALARHLSIEVGLAYARPGITTELSQDEEASPMAIDAERLAQYVIDVAAAWQLPRPAAGRLRPFVAGGVGYLRQLYDERTLVETGRIYYVGGGARYWLRRGDGRQRSLGLRGDVRATFRQDGVDFEGRTRVWPAMSVMMFWEP